MDFVPRLHTSTMKTFARPCGRLKYKPKPMMKRILKDVRKTQLAYKVPCDAGNRNNHENRRGYDVKTKAKVADAKMHHMNYIVKDQENQAMTQPPKPYPTKRSVRLPFTQPTNKNAGSIASSHAKPNPLMVKEVTRTKSMLGFIHSLHNGDTSKQCDVKLKGQSSLAKDKIGRELKSCKEKNDSILKESNLSEANELLAPNKGHSYEDNKHDKICNDEVMIGNNKKIPLHVGLGSIKKDVMKGNEVSNRTPSTKIEPKKHDRDEFEYAKNLSPTKKRRRYIIYDYEEDEHGDQDPIDSAKVTQPIDVSIWSGIFNIGGNDYIPFAAHLSTKSCKKVWDLSGSIPSIVQVKKLLRSEVWPRSLEASTPTDENIGLYFFPPKMRLDKGMDQLVKEVVEKDMALSAVIGEAQMLVFPSTLLPEKYQTFQGKHYLWAIFKRRDEDKQQAAAIAAEQQPQQHPGNSVLRCKQEQQKNTELQDASKQKHYEAKRKEPNNNQQETPVLKKPSRLVKKEPPPTPTKDTRSSVMKEQSTAASARENPADDGSTAVPANHGSGRVIGLVVRQTQGVEELIQQMRRGGALVATMEGELMASSFGATAQW